MSFLYVNDGKIDEAGLGDPPWEMRPWSQEIIEEDATKAPWQNFFAFLRTNPAADQKVWTVSHIIDPTPPSASGRELSDILQGLQYAGVNENDALTLVDWMGNNFTYSDPWFSSFGFLSLVERQANAILNPEYCTSNQTNRNIGEVFTALANYSPALHKFILDRVKAKARKVAPRSYESAYEPLVKTVVKTGGAVGEVVEAGVDIVQAAADAGKEVAKGALSAAKYTIPILLVLAGVAVWYFSAPAMAARKSATRAAEQAGGRAFANRRRKRLTR